MFSSILSNISLNDTEMLKEKCYKMQQQHKKKQQFLVCLEEVVKAHHMEHMVQKARREIEAKAREEAEKQRLVKEKKKKKQLEYLQQLFLRVLRNPRLWNLSVRRSSQKIIGTASLSKRLKKNS